MAKVRRGWLGVTVQPLSASLVEYIKSGKRRSIIADLQKRFSCTKIGLARGE